MSEKRGVLVGVIDKKGRTRNVCFVTNDGGENWTEVKLKDTPVSLFFLNDSIGWMVTRKDLYVTEESGLTWKKIKAPNELLKVYFRDPMNGWGVGLEKNVWRTTNGGHDWEPVPEAEKPQSDENRTVYAWIAFADENIGMIGGWNVPRRPQPRVPAWMDPASARRRYQIPQLSLILETKNGGESWNPTTASIFGQITQMKLSKEGWGVGLITFKDTFEWPSEVHLISLKSGGSSRVYREKDRRITDIAVGAPPGPIYLGGVEQLGPVFDSPIPSKVKILVSRNGKDYREMEVDYRAVARNVLLSAVSPIHVWAATDTGMVLKLEQ